MKPLHSVSLWHIAGHQRERSISLSAACLEKGLDCHEVTSQLSLVQAKQAKWSQLLLLSLAFKNFQHPSHPLILWCFSYTVIDNSVEATAVKHWEGQSPPLAVWQCCSWCTLRHGSPFRLPGHCWPILICHHQCRKQAKKALNFSALSMSLLRRWQQQTNISSSSPFAVNIFFKAFIVVLPNSNQVLTTRILSLQWWPASLYSSHVACPCLLCLHIFLLFPRSRRSLLSQASLLGHFWYFGIDYPAYVFWKIYNYPLQHLIIGLIPLFFSYANDVIDMGQSQSF